MTRNDLEHEESDDDRQSDQDSLQSGSEDYEEEDEEVSENMSSDQSDVEENGHDANGEVKIISFDDDQQLEKANAVKNQLLIFDSLLETRIRLQKLLTLSSSLPQGTEFEKLIDCDSLLVKTLHSECINGVRKFGKILDEIDSFININPSNNELKRKLSFPDDTTRQKRFDSLKTDSFAVIDDWHNRTKLVHSNLDKYSALEVAPSTLIKKVLENPERLIEKTRVKRLEHDDQDEDQASTITTTKDPNIYNDDDFYHILLKQLLENNSDQYQDGETMSRKYTEIQSLRNKMKRKVDTRASKGRKVRYDVHSKLVNFMAPIDNSTLEDESKNQLFKSLFGQVCPS